MPLTPFHLGPALLAGALCYRWLDLPTLLAASVVVDVRAALVLFGPLDPPVHGVLTTFVGGAAVALALAAAVLLLQDAVPAAFDWVRLDATGRPGPVVAGALVGLASHVLLDATLYTDVRPFSPLATNPFYVGPEAFVPVYLGCFVAVLVAAPIAGFRWYRYHF